mgnify:CR=1 FL=1
MSCAGIKVGIVGLVEEEWLETLGAVNVADMEYKDFIEVGRAAARELKVRGCGGLCSAVGSHAATGADGWAGGGTRACGQALPTGEDNSRSAWVMPAEASSCQRTQAWRLRLVSCCRQRARRC